MRIPNFGVFEVKDTAARKARNPQTGEEVESACRPQGAFQAGQGAERTRWTVRRGFPVKQRLFQTPQSG
ncbi:MAG: HU family DNA-binding protein [Alphaproteobacteria bacterium]